MAGFPQLKLPSHHEGDSRRFPKQQEICLSRALTFDNLHNQTNNANL